jgi:adenylate cyclase
MDDRKTTVLFADVSGSTKLYETAGNAIAHAAVESCVNIMRQKTQAAKGRVVKTIGDEVMFATDDGVAAAEIALSLADAYHREKDLPGVRVGLACGPVLSWEGDLYGATVNLASRLVNLAHANSVLVSEELGATLQNTPGFALRHLRPVHLQGIGRVRSWVLRRAG